SRCASVAHSLRTLRSSPRPPGLLYHLFLSLTLHPPPRSTLFPYTTLFRSLVFVPINANQVTEVNLLGRQQVRHWINNVALDGTLDRKSTRLNSSHEWISYAVFCLKKKNKKNNMHYIT